MMEIVVNGEKMQVPAGTTVAALLKRYGLQPVRVAVERNREIVAKGRYEETALAAGDQVEIVTFVGGG